MAAEIKPIRDEAGYNAALAEIERLWGAPSGTAKGDRLEVLITLVDAYPIAAIEFRMDQLGLTRRKNSESE
jgi:HTH-type transcriptional regulator / antitoxin HigA